MQAAVERCIDVIAEKPDSPVTEESVRSSGMETPGAEESCSMYLDVGNFAVGSVISVSGCVGRDRPYP